MVPQLDAAARDTDHASLVEACRARTAAGPAVAPPVFASPAAGMGRLAEAVVAGLPAADVRTGRAVLAVEPDGDRWRSQVSDGTSIEADGVVLATPAAATAGLLAPLPGAAEAATLLAGVEYASVAIAVLAFPLDHLGRPLDRSGFLVAAGRGHRAHGLLVVEHQVGPPRTRRRRRHRRGAGLDRSVG